MDAVARQVLINDLCAVGARGAGTDAERRAADLLADRLRRTGRRAEIEPTFVHPQWALVHAAHAMLAIAGSILATVEPAAGFALVLLAGISTYLDLDARIYLIRSLFFRRASQNVVSPGERPEAPVRVILAAHYDAARTGFVFGSGFKLLNRLSQRARVLLHPLRVVFWAGFVPLLPILGAQMAGLDGEWLQVLQLPSTLLLIVAVFLLVDIALSPIVPGAYDNASGVAAVLSAAEELGEDPPANLDVWVVLPGAEECLAEGMRGYLRAHDRELRRDRDRARTVVINVDSVSWGNPSYMTSEGGVVSVPLDPRLIELSKSLADADRGGENRFGAEPMRYAQLDDALPAQLRGHPSIAILGAEDGVLAPWYHTPDDLPENVDAAALTRSTEFVVSLIRLLDRDVGRRAAAG